MLLIDCLSFVFKIEVHISSIASSDAAVPASGAKKTILRSFVFRVVLRSSVRHGSIADDSFLLQGKFLIKRIYKKCTNKEILCLTRKCQRHLT